MIFILLSHIIRRNSSGTHHSFTKKKCRIGTSFTQIVYGDKITAQSKWLSSERLIKENKSDYFLDPNKNEENNKEITVGTDEDKNVLDIYYINTNFNNTTETISKVTNTEKVISSSQKVSYKVTYNTSINNVRKGDKVVVTITDTLPGSIIENESTLNGGVYNSNDNTITWTYTYIINEYQKVYRVSKEINYIVKYENYLNFNGNTLVNTANGYTTVSHEGLDDKVTEGKEDSASTRVEIKGTVNVYFKDNNDNEIATKVALGEKLAGTSYTTTAKNITGYTLDETKLPSNANGNYIEGNIDVVYYYTKNDGNITENEVTKIGPDTVNSINSTFNYTLTYKGKVENYVGKAKLTLTDELPYNVIIESKDNRCELENNTITCITEYDINGTKEINESFNISVKYTNIDTDKIVNKVNSKLALENNTAEDEDEKETEVYKGTVVATYKDAEGNKLHENVTTTELAGSEYITEEKSFYGYTLKEVTGADKEGTYKANTTLEVNYIYTKNIGDVTENKVNKAQNNIITDINSQYNYVLSYSGKVENYIGDITLELTDTLPYNAEIISKDNKCVVTGKTIVCTDIYTIDENHQVINATFNIVLKYTNVGAEVKNIVNSKLIYGNKIVTDSDEVIDVIPSGKVTATYTTDKKVKLHEDIITTDLVGKEYTTEEKEFFGYTLKEVNGNKTGTYTKEDIKVDYIYTKNAGDIENPITEKTGPATIESIDGTFRYTITGSGNIKKYVGDATLIVKDILPYAIDTEKSILDNRCQYNANDNTITCRVDYNNITENDYTNGVFEVNETFNLSLVFIGIDSDKVINKATSTIKLDGNEITTEDEEETEVYKGTVVATYKDTEGNKLHEDVITTDLVGKEYSTEEKEFFGYTLKEVNGNKTGTYTKEDIKVDYIYTKNAGDIENPITEKTGPATIESIDGTFRYTITGSGNIKKYVGDATLIVKDILPYAIDTEKSILDNRCQYNANDNTITCRVDYNNITENDYTNGVFEVNETFNLSLVFIGIDSDKVINKATSTIKLDGNEITTEDEEETEVYKGTVVATYKDTEGNKLHEDVITTDLVGKEYSTEEKEFFGYTLKEIKGNENGIYTEETIYVDYIYTKTTGTGDIEELPPQTGVEKNNLYEYLLLISMLVLSLKGYKKVKETL